MSKYCVGLSIYRRPAPNESIDELYAELVRRMITLSSPLSWKNALLPRAPIREKGDLAACYSVKYTDTRVKHQGAYRIRDARYIYDEKTADDTFSFDIRKLNAEEYRDILRGQFPELIEAVRGYRAIAYLEGHSVKYSRLHERKRRDLSERGDIDVNGRNNIFTLNVAQFWDAELCQRALGYGCDEVIKRLTGKVPLVQPLMDGVYIVFNDNPNLTFEEFCAVNDRFKPILGLA